MTAFVLDPTSERTVAARTLLARPASIEGRTIGLLDIAKMRGDVFLDRLEVLLHERGGQGPAVQEADLHQAGARRSAPRDRDSVRDGDRGARRLRQLHVVQCARHR